MDLATPGEARVAVAILWCIAWHDGAGVADDLKITMTWEIL